MNNNNSDSILQNKNPSAINIFLFWLIICYWSGMMGTASVSNVPPGAGPTIDREHDENGTRCAADRDVGRIQRSQGRRWFSLTRWLRELSAVAIRCVVVDVFDSEVRGSRSGGTFDGGEGGRFCDREYDRVSARSGGWQ